MNKQIAILKIRPNLKELPLPEYYNSLPETRKPKNGDDHTPRKEFLLAVEEKTGRPVASIRRWVTGSVQPAPLEKKAIAELLECSIECLFPE